MTHHLKIWPGSFEAVVSGEKHHEIRSVKDRSFDKGDNVIFEEWVPTDAKPEEEGTGLLITAGCYTGRRILRRITYVTKAGSWGLPPDRCVFTIQ